MRTPLLARRVLEGAAFVAAVALVVTSAAMTKQSKFKAPLVAIDSAPGAFADMPAPVVGPAEFGVRETVSATAEAAVVPAVVEPITLDPDVRIFDGRPVKPVKTLWMTVTAYSPDHRSCGKSADGVTASNKSVWTNGMRLAAADRRVLPFGTIISVPGYAGGDVIPVLDVGGAIKGKRLDLLYPTHSIARKWGVRKVPVTVWGYADEAEASAKPKPGSSKKL